MKFRVITAVPLILTALLSVQAASSSPAPSAQVGPDLRYGGPAFADVARTSYRTVGLQGTFEDWLAGAYKGAGVKLGTGDTLTAALDARAAELRAAKGDARVQLERDTAAWAHRFVKKAVPKFSLERGYELANVAGSGQRQCLAQSFIIAGLLQRAGMQAGAVMVWANPQGQQSNLGHVVATVRLSGGQDLLVDASDPTPFVHHQGLLVRTAQGYRFVKPTYAADDTIGRYTLSGTGGTLAVKDAAPLSLTYLQSQFDYYRGERARGGFMGTGVGRATPDGLKQSALYLTRAVQEDPQNALAVYVLGHVLERQGLAAQSRSDYLKANALYTAQGHVPSGMQTVMAAMKKQAGGSGS